MLPKAQNILRMKLLIRVFYRFINYKFSNKHKPISLTINLTGKCNLKCKTCKVWKNKSRDLEFSEWKKISEKIETPLWITITGGEPFLREDFSEIIKSICKNAKPVVLNIATNGMLTEKIIKDIKKIKDSYSGILRINISIDGLKETHELIRGKVCYDRAIETFRQLKRINGIQVGFHTTISKHNISEVKKIYEEHKSLKPDSHNFEIAQIRHELKNQDSEIEAEKDQIIKVMNYLVKSEKKPFPISIVGGFRKSYYRHIIGLLKGHSPLKCRAARDSFYITNTGKVWSCCVLGKEIGDLKKEPLNRIINSKQAQDARELARNCSCTMANAYITNRICKII